MWHGTLENDGFRRAWLAEIAAASGSPWRPQADAPSFAGRREAMIDKLADAIEDNADLELLVGVAR
jgi:adenosylcobyric acid synthase